MKQKTHILLFSITILFINTAIGQSNEDTARKSYFKFKLNYLSNAVYSGRKDSSIVPYLRPSIGYFDKSGFYIASELSLLVNPDEPKRIDLISLESGYGFSINKKIDAGFFASKFFYSNASFAVGSELKGLAGAYLGYNPGPFSINIGGDLLFSANTDINANIGISHEFESGEENNKWTFNPTAQLNAGTQYFNQSYYETRKYTFATGSGVGSNRGKGKGHSSSSTTTTVKTLTFKDSNRFAILDYEFSFPINYDKKWWGLYALPVVAVPTSAATYVLDNTIQKEKISTTFFIEVGAYVKF
ncbi:MAG: hypothetical protein M3004_07285 [Bacteroidota bacterium]|nr:hypothetical protein [Bacteroidota bacterium]